MAKTAKKRPDPAANPRSRAAKRATSPSINVDKSLKDISRATDATPVLAHSRNGGVTKKKKAKQMTRGQRARQEKGLARAEAVMDQLAKKVDVSKSRKKQIDSRRNGWDDINKSSKHEAQETFQVSGRELSPERDHRGIADDVDMTADNIVPAKIESTATAAGGNAGARLEEVDLIS